MPAFELTVPQETYDLVRDRMSEAFADSYLYGAVQRNGKLIPRTLTAYYRLRDYVHARAAIAELKLELVEPQPFGTPGGSQQRHATEPEVDDWRRSVKLPR